MIVNYDCNHRYTVLATINTIVNYDDKTFIVQTTVGIWCHFHFVAYTWAQYATLH
jgi:hypothetical protein